MIKKNGTLISLIIMLSLAAVPCFAGGKREDKAAAIDDRVRVFVSILPQRYFVEKIGGGKVLVDVMVLPGRSPTTYEPTPTQVVSLSRADVFFIIGVPFEKAFIPRISESLKSLRIEDTSAGIEKRTLKAHVHDDEGDGRGHEARSVDPHIWLSPVLVKKQAAIILKTLVELSPASEDVFNAGYRELISELDDVHREISASIEPFRGSVLFVFHPSFGYFADEYGLRQVAVELEGREPSPSELEEIIEYANKEGVKIIFAQPEFSKRSVQALADAVDGSVVVLNPLNPDYINSMREIAAEIRKAYK
ncbi:MAG: zinc ABC transporter substrate-binding protein [Spirochaetales bacterium]|nr:zinc ABC transporter substrate-binding protein [Spirochaetales bacterium]